MLNNIIMLQAGEAYLDSGAGSTLLKFGLILVLANIILKLVLGIGLWKMAMDSKNTENGLKISDNYPEEQIEGVDPAILKGQNNNEENNEYENDNN